MVGDPRSSTQTYFQGSVTRQLNLDKSLEQLNL